MINVCYLGGLIDATLDSKEFGFSGYNINSVMKSLDDRYVMDMDVSNWYSNMIFDAHIWYYNHYF